MQSEYLPAVTVYFLLSIGFALSCFIWFIIENFFRSHKYVPAPLRFYVSMLRKLEGLIASMFKKIKRKARKKVQARGNVDINSVSDNQVYF